MSVSQLRWPTRDSICISACLQYMVSWHEQGAAGYGRVHGGLGLQACHSSLCAVPCPLKSCVDLWGPLVVLFNNKSQLGMCLHRAVPSVSSAPLQKLAGR